MGMYQAQRYYPFLFTHGLGDDARQEIHIAILESWHLGHKQYSNAVNRRLYSLSRSAGFRKRHMNEMKDHPEFQWWEYPLRPLQEWKDCSIAVTP